MTSCQRQKIYLIILFIQIDTMAESEEESFQSGVLGSAECRGTLCISSVTHFLCLAPCSSMTPCAAVAQGRFFAFLKIFRISKNCPFIFYIIQGIFTFFQSEKFEIRKKIKTHNFFVM